MGFWQIVLYLSDLIHAGHKWQRQNIIGTNSERAFKLSVFQIVGCLLAGWFVYKNPSGISDTAIDYLLSSLSIITGFFFAVILLSYDQFNKIEVPDNGATEDEKIKALKSINFLKKYNALSCYAILLAIIVIFMLIGTLLFGQKTDIGEDFEVASSLENVALFPTLCFYGLVVWRFLMIYFLLDFFIITIYAICSLFQFLNLQMLDLQLPFAVNASHVPSEYQVYKRNFGKRGVFLVLLMGILLLLFVTSLCFIHK